MLNIKDRIKTELVLIDDIVYGVEPRHYYDDGCRHIYKFVDIERNVYVWKTSVSLGISLDDNTFEPCDIGDKVVIKSCVKDISNYKGEEQIVLTRCKVENISHDVLTEQEIQDIKRDLQICRISNVKEVKTVSYKEYKEEYNKYETVVGSFIRNDFGCFIDVIITE